MNIFTVNCWKDENKVKEAGSSPKKETWLGMEYCSRLSGTRVSYIKKHSREWELSLYSWPPVLPVWIWPNKWADADSTWVKQLNPNKTKQEVSCTVILTLSCLFSGYTFHEEKRLFCFRCVWISSKVDLPHKANPFVHLLLPKCSTDLVIKTREGNKKTEARLSHEVLWWNQIDTLVPRDHFPNSVTR